MARKRAGKRAKDWHRADVLAALKKRGLSLKEVGERAGYQHADSAYHVLRTAMPRLEFEIGRILGVPPQSIWPSRYDDAGLPKGWRGIDRTIAVNSGSDNGTGEAA